MVIRSGFFKHTVIVMTRSISSSYTDRMIMASLVANQIPGGCRKALFLTGIGQDAFLKLKMLVSPTLLKIFKRVQQDKEEVAKYLAELRKLGKTCNLVIILRYGPL